jgi:uncharacterized protein YjbI with pentapeptide repeats
MLDGADLGDGTLIRANFSQADLNGANLHRADLGGANLYATDLGGVNFRDANLWAANLSSAQCQDTDFTNARLDHTNFADTDLSLTKGLQSVYHAGPSEISISTLYKSNGQIPESFLRGCGAPNTFIDFARSLVNKTMDFYSCFISYSNKDKEFAERLYADLQTKVCAAGLRLKT